MLLEHKSMTLEFGVAVKVLEEYIDPKSRTSFCNGGGMQLKAQ
jgi:hypothetical protein